MANGFFQIPDWFSSENQGAGVAIAANNLVAMMVDHPGQQPNRGLYRLGKNLDASGNVTGGWTAWTDIPDWFSFENQGADIAVADVFNNGGVDLIVLIVDNPVGQNRGLYRIGHGLNADGAVTGGWTNWIDVPDWFSFENQGAGVTVTPRDAQGKCHLMSALSVRRTAAGDRRSAGTMALWPDGNDRVAASRHDKVDQPDQEWCHHALL